MVELVKDEQLLIKELNQGNKDVYKLLFNTYYRVLCLYASSLTKNSISAEDIVQNVLLNLWVKRSDLKIRTSLKSYLYRSIYNLYVNEYDKKQRETLVLDKIQYEVLRNSIRVEEEVIQRKIQLIYKEIEKLPPKSREIFVLHKQRGLSYREIAQALSISENTVESHISRALKRIRKNLKSDKVALAVMLYHFL